VNARLGFILYRNCETSLEDYTSIEGFPRCGVSTENNGGPWWPPVVVGGGEEAWDVGEGFWKKEGERNDCYPRLHKKYDLKH